MYSFAKFFDHLAIERWDVVWFPACHESIVDHDFFVDPVSTGVFHVRLDVRPRGQLSSTHHAGIDQDPWTVTNDRGWFARVEKMTRELERFWRRAQLVRIHQSTGNENGVEIIRLCFIKRQIDVELVA